MATEAEAKVEDGGHIWHERVFASMQVKCCMNCGFIKNETQPNKPCPGPIGVSLRGSNEARKAGA